MSEFFTNYVPLMKKSPPYGVQIADSPANKPDQAPRFQWPPFPDPAEVAVVVDQGQVRTTVSDAGEISAAAIRDLKIQSSQDKMGGILINNTTGVSIQSADVNLSGMGENDFVGIGAGVVANNGSDVVLRDSTIETSGAARSCTTVTKGSKLHVYNCRLTANGGPVPETFTYGEAGTGMLKPPPALEISGSSRTHLTVDNSEAYFYNSSIIADGWGALSTDACKGHVRLEANNCDITVQHPGYATYADADAIVVFNNCRVHSGSHLAFIDKDGSLTLNNVDAVSARYGFVIHSAYGTPDMIAELKLDGGVIECQEALLTIRSANAFVNIHGTRIKTRTGILAQAMTNSDPISAKVGDAPVYGSHLILTNTSIEGHVLNDDPQRILSVVLAKSSLKGAIKDAYLTLDAASGWTATADSTVILMGPFQAGSIDAPAGITITAAAGEGCALAIGQYALAAGGLLLVVA